MLALTTFEWANRIDKDSPQVLLGLTMDGIFRRKAPVARTTNFILSIKTKDPLPLSSSSKKGPCIRPSLAAWSQCLFLDMGSG